MNQELRCVRAHGTPPPSPCAKQGALPVQSDITKIFFPSAKGRQSSSSSRLAITSSYRGAGSSSSMSRKRRPERLCVCEGRQGTPQRTYGASAAITS